MFTPTFRKDGDIYIVPLEKLSFPSAEDAIIGGEQAGLTSGYGLYPTGAAVEVAEEGYTGPHILAAVGNLTVCIISGPALESVLQQKQPEVLGIDLASGPDTGTEADPPFFGGGGGFDGAGAGGKF